MLAVLFLAQKQPKIHRCMHDKLAKDVKLIVNNSTSARKALNNQTFEKIRIQFDYRFIDKTFEDPYMCKEENQKITIDGKEYTCKKDGLVTTEKLENLKGTLENVKNYLSELIYVQRETKPFQLKSRENDFTYPSEQTVTEYDLVVTVLSRPFDDDSDALAMAAPLQSFDNYRPVQGFIYCNILKAPVKIESETSGSRYSFNTYLHEMFHVLAFSLDLFPHFHPIGDNTAHKDPTCALKKLGKDMTFLTTPYAHIFAKNRYGVDKFTGDNGVECPAGIELENGGSDATQFSHLEARTMLDDIMIGVNLGPDEQDQEPFGRVSDATLAVLLDTGNYKVDYRKASPMIWGNPESINGKPIENFAIGPPQTTFPSSYLVYEDSYGTALPNYKTIGLFPLSDDVANAHCGESNADKEYCDHKSFYNPKNLEKYGGSDVFDYMMFIIPYMTCPTGKAAMRGLSDCYDYTCDGYSSVTFKVDGKSVKCTKESDPGLEYDDYSVSCVDPERFCRTVKLFEMKFKKNPFITNVEHLSNTDQGPGPDIAPDGVYDPSSFGKPEETKDGLSGIWEKYKLYIIIGAAVIAVIIIVIIIAVCCRKSKKSGHNKKGNKHKSHHKRRHSSSDYDGDKV